MKAIGSLLTRTFGDRPLTLTVYVVLLLLAGCRSRGINVTITNTGPATIHNLELNYPGGSFGTAIIQPGASFPYRIKVLGDGQMKLALIDAHGREHHENGPEVHAGDDGEITVTVDQDANNTWKTSLQPK